MAGYNLQARQQEEAYQEQLLEFQRERAAQGLPFESWTTDTGRMKVGSDARDRETYAQMLSEAEALRANPPEVELTQDEKFAEALKARWETPEGKLELEKLIAEDPEAWNDAAVAKAAKEMNEEATPDVVPVRPIDEGLWTGRGESEEARFERETAEALANQTEGYEENEGYTGNLLTEEPTVFATQAQLDEIRGLEKKIADDSGGSLQYGDYERMSTGEAEKVLQGLKDAVDWDESSGAPNAGLYNPIVGEQTELLGPEGAEYDLPGRPPPVFGGAGTGAVSNALRSPQGGLDFSKGNPFQGAAYDAGFQDFNTLGAMQQSNYNKMGAGKRQMADAVGEQFASGNVTPEQQTQITNALRQQQGVLDQRQAGWDAQKGAAPPRANTTGGTALMPTYTGAQ